jgi:hypothetical protein
MIRKFSFLIFVIILAGLLSILIMYFQIQDSNVCDELVIMNDGSQIEATEVVSYRSGMSTIKMCGGTWMDTPTVNIKMVKPINL